jgi:hypothetical protein
LVLALLHPQRSEWDHCTSVVNDKKLKVDPSSMILMPSSIKFYLMVHKPIRHEDRWMGTVPWQSWWRKGSHAITFIHFRILYALYLRIQKTTFHNIILICWSPLILHRSTSGWRDNGCTKTCMSSRILQHKNTRKSFIPHK